MGCLVAAHVGLANKLQPVNETPAAGAQHKVFLLRPVDLCPPAGLFSPPRNIIGQWPNVLAGLWSEGTTWHCSKTRASERKIRH